jgi:hypothetical protein
MRIEGTIWKPVVWRMTLLLLVLIGAASSPHARGSKADELDDEMRGEFQRRLANYVEIQKKAMITVPPLPKEGVTDVSLIEAREQHFADTVRGLRPNAKRGDLFTQGVTGMFASTIRAQVDGPGGDAVMETILGEGNPESPESPADVPLAVNGAYPSGAPLSTMPPSLLFALPTLPKGLEYRFVGHNLILLDSQAMLIVDIMPDAV